MGYLSTSDSRYHVREAKARERSGGDYRFSKQ